MRILVTGGAGFIASHIVDAYIKDGHEVIIIDNLSTGKKDFINKKARFYKIDIRNRRELELVLKKEKPSVINHHAAQISVRHSVENPFFDLEINLIGLLNLIQQGKKAGLKKMIFASSGGVVYGEADTIPTSENYVPLKPQSPYGITKLSSEYYLDYFFQNYRIPYIALRYSNVYGPRQNPHGEAGVIAIFTSKLLRGETSIINGDGLQTRDYVYVKDVVEANRKALISDKVGAFNIGTSRETNVLEIFNRLRKLIGKNTTVSHGSAKKGEQKRSCLNCNLALKVLGWKAESTLNQGLKKTVEYFQQNEKV